MRYKATAEVNITIDLEDIRVESHDQLEAAVREEIGKRLNMRGGGGYGDPGHCVSDIGEIELTNWDYVD